MSSNRIDLIPYGGLGNRLRSIASTYRIAQINNSELNVFWAKAEECNAFYNDLFVDTKYIKVHNVKNKFIFNRPKSKNLYLPALIGFASNLFNYDHFHLELAVKWGGGIHRKILFLNTGNRTRKQSKLRREIAPSLKGKNLVYTCHTLTDDYNVGKIFEPSNDINMMIEAIKPKLINSIGIHIRYTDNLTSKIFSPLDLFYKKLDEELISNAETNFFLATDSAFIKTSLRARYGQRVIYNDIILDRSEKAGIQGAVADLWCLSLTKKIYGSFFSSFSEVAANIGQKDLIILS